MYKLTFDRAGSLVLLTITGMLSVADVHALVAEMIDGVAAARFTSYGLIIDISDAPVQSQDMITAIGAQMARMQRVRSIAIVTGAMLARMQVRRIFTQPFVGFVESHREALEWVASVDA